MIRVAAQSMSTIIGGGPWVFEGQQLLQNKADFQGEQLLQNKGLIAGGNFYKKSKKSKKICRFFQIFLRILATFTK